MTSASSSVAVRKKLTSRIAAVQKLADATKKSAKLAKAEFKAAKQKFKEAKRAAKKHRKESKALKAELAAMKKPTRPSAGKPATRRKKLMPAPAPAVPPEAVSPVIDAGAAPENQAPLP